MVNYIWILAATIIAGIGFTVGKFVGNIITDVGETFVIVAFKRMARSGNEVMQDVCRKHKINYEGGVNKTAVKNQIGFRID